MKTASIHHVETKDGNFEQILKSQDLVDLINNDNSGINKITVFRKNDFSITRIQSDLQSTCHLLNTGIMAINSDCNWCHPENLLPLIETTNAAIRILEEIKLKVSYQIDLELAGDGN